MSIASNALAAARRRVIRAFAALLGAAACIAAAASQAATVFAAPSVFDVYYGAAVVLRADGTFFALSQATATATSPEMCCSVSEILGYSRAQDYLRTKIDSAFAADASMQQQLGAFVFSYLDANATWPASPIRGSPDQHDPARAAVQAALFAQPFAFSIESDSGYVPIGQGRYTFPNVDILAGAAGILTFAPSATVNVYERSLVLRVTEIPEPSSALLVAAGLGAAFAVFAGRLRRGASQVSPGV